MQANTPLTTEQEGKQNFNWDTQRAWKVVNDNTTNGLGTAPAYSPDERWPAGEFVNQSRYDLGLPAWTKANRSIENTDVVLWYNFGMHHIPRPEDWPIMPVDTVSFWLKPAGFFDRNPSIDAQLLKACHSTGKTTYEPVLVTPVRPT